MRTKRVYAYDVNMHIGANGLMYIFLILFSANENEDREEHAASANTIQKLNEENASLKSKLSQLSHE